MHTQLEYPALPYIASNGGSILKNQQSTSKNPETNHIRRPADMDPTPLPTAEDLAGQLIDELRRTGRLSGRSGVFVTPTGICASIGAIVVSTNGRAAR